MAHAEEFGSLPQQHLLQHFASSGESPFALAESERRRAPLFSEHVRSRKADHVKASWPRNEKKLIRNQ